MVQFSMYKAFQVLKHISSFSHDHADLHCYSWFQCTGATVVVYGAWHGLHQLCTMHAQQENHDISHRL